MGEFEIDLVDEQPAGLLKASAAITREQRNPIGAVVHDGGAGPFFVGEQRSIFGVGDRRAQRVGLLLLRFRLRFLDLTLRDGDVDPAARQKPHEALQAIEIFDDRPALAA